MAKFCSSCGARLEDAVKFCPSCGSPQAAPPPQQPMQQQQQSPAPPMGYQAQPPMQQPALTEKQQVLWEAPGVLNRPEQPWAVTIEGDSIVARWRWMDAAFFAPHEATNQVRQYTFTVTLTDKKTWKELDTTENTSAGVKLNGGKLSFGGSKNSFSGNQNRKSFQLGLGQDNQTGQAGLVSFKFDTTAVKQPIRDYLTARGWKKAGLLG